MEKLIPFCEKFISIHFQEISHSQGQKSYKQRRFDSFKYLMFV